MNVEVVMGFIQMSYWVTFLLSSGATLYFVLERSSAAPEMKTVYTTAAFVSFVMALQYYEMRNMVGFEGAFAYPTEYRFLGWMVIFPALILMSQKFIGIPRDGTVARSSFAAFLIVFGAWMSEFHAHDWAGFWMSIFAWGFVVYHVRYHFQGKMDNYKKYIIFGWFFVPLGALSYVMGASAEVMMWREAYFCFVDVFLILRFCHQLVTYGRK